MGLLESKNICSRILKAMLAAGASGSAYAAIRYLVFYEIIFHASADGMGYYRIGNQMFTVEEVKNMLCRRLHAKILS